jgi:serine/alanine adding enzyme
MSEIERNYRLVDTFEAMDQSQWGEFVRNHPNGTLFQTPEYYLIHKGCKGFEPVVFAALDHSGNLVGVLVAVVSRLFSIFPFSYLSSRAVVFGGPLVVENSAEIVRFLLRAFTRRTGRRVVYSQFRNLYDTAEMRPAFDSVGAEYEEHLNLLFDLCKSEEALWSEVRPQRRNEIKKSQKKGVSVHEFHTEEEVARSYDILRSVYKNARLPLADICLFTNALHILYHKGYLKFFGAYFEEKLIGTMYVLSYNGVLYDWYAGSYKGFYTKNPNDLLPWMVMMTGKNEQFFRFDFGGAGKPDVPYGVRDYKMRFGGELVNFGRYEIAHNKTILTIMSFAFKLLQRLRR